MPKQSLDFRTPLLNAAGTLGFHPEGHSQKELDRLGAFITHPISQKPRKPAQGPRLLGYEGGVLLHTGLPNPGFKTALRRFRARWARASLPIIVHLLVSEAVDVEEMVRQLEECENLLGIELGLPPKANEQTTTALTESAVGELPIIVEVPLPRAALLASAAMDAGASAVSLSPPRGVLPDAEGNLIQGRLYGPAIYPQALAAVDEIAAAGLPVIAGGGVYHTKDVESMLEAGAMAVELDSILWRGGFEV